MDCAHCPYGQTISIHPPRAGRDRRNHVSRHDSRYFNPPAPCGAGRRYLDIVTAFDNFNPPAPCGAGPKEAERRKGMLEFQSTRPVRGGTYLVLMEVGSILISIHPPRAGRDPRFRSSLSRRRISIHPPRAGRDPTTILKSLLLIYFNPPAPCGAGRGSRIRTYIYRVFQSTRPVRGGTTMVVQIVPM